MNMRDAMRIAESAPGMKASTKAREAAFLAALERLSVEHGIVLMGGPSLAYSYTPLESVTYDTTQGGAVRANVNGEDAKRWLDNQD